MNRGRHKKENAKGLLYPKIFKECFTIEQLKKIIEYQIKAGNEPNLKVFEINPRAGTHDGGFSWDCTNEGFIYWDKLFSRYRKILKDEKIKTLKTIEL